MASVLFYESNDLALLEQVKNVLTENDILFFVKNENTQNVFSASTAYIGYDNIADLCQIFIDESDMEKARDLVEIDSGSYKPLKTNPENRENIRNLVILLILSFSSSYIACALFTISYHLRLKGQYLKTRVVLIAIQAISLYFGITLLINEMAGKGYPIGDSAIIMNIIAFVVLMSVKSFSLMLKKRRFLSFLFILPLIAASIGFIVLLVIFKLK